MENLYTNKTASLTELRDPKKVIDQANGKPVAIFNRNQLEGYFVPAAAVEPLEFHPAKDGQAVEQFQKRQGSLGSTLDYLRDK